MRPAYVKDYVKRYSGRGGSHGPLADEPTVKRRSRRGPSLALRHREVAAHMRARRGHSAPAHDNVKRGDAGAGGKRRPPALSVGRAQGGTGVGRGNGGHSALC
jgi:hypothetical protein